MIPRTYYLKAIENAFKTHPVVALLGPRQCGKTTLAREYLGKPILREVKARYFDLEAPSDLVALQQPQLILEANPGLIVIDEIQRLPNIFPLLRVLCDKRPREHQFLILGSASQELIQQSSESLAGRIAYIEVSPFHLFEVHDATRLHQRGGFATAYLADSETDANFWLENYIRNFLERDIPQLGFKIPSMTMRRFWTMLAHYHGNILNSSEIARSMAISDHSVRHYLDILSGTFMVRQLMPWHENILKRQIKRPKIYLRDSGIFHRLMGIDNAEQLWGHPKNGASWEGFALEEILACYPLAQNNAYFWGVHNEIELDLLLFHGGKRIGFEFKFSDAPTFTHSMKKSCELLNLDHLTVIYPGKSQYLLAENIHVIGLEQFVNENWPV